MTDNKKKSQVCIVCRSLQKKLFSYQKFDYYYCEKCTLVSTAPLPTQKQILTHYKKKFDKGNYALLQKFSDQYKLVYETFADQLVQSLSRKIKGAKILDIGCFTGEFLEILQQKGADVYGLEIQTDAVKIANKKLGGKVYQADVMSDDFPKIKFDAITLIGLVEHVTNPVLLLKRCEELLKKDGIIFIQTPNSGSLFARILKKYWPPYAPIEHIHLFSRKSITFALRESNFTDIQIRQSWKKLPLAYVYNMLENFGPEFHRVLKPFYLLLNSQLIPPIPLYIGEMVIIARKK